VKVLVVGAGAREHALAEALVASPAVTRLVVVPGNGGTAAWADAAAPGLENAEALAAWAQAQGFDRAVIGPEGPLAAGLVDALQARGVKAFGPPASAARLEASKGFAKAFMARHGIPTAAAVVCEDFAAARAEVEARWNPRGLVIKADGLAAGKGVVVARTRNEALAALKAFMAQGALGEAGRRVVIEEVLEGPEASLIAVLDGRTWRSFPLARDHKTLCDGGLGPNTGGMGVVTPIEVPADLNATLVEMIMAPLVQGLVAEGLAYAGVIFVGLMLTARGPRVLEFNCRFGDPEAPALLPGLGVDAWALFEACLAGTLEDLLPGSFALPMRPGNRVCVVAASQGYPGAFVSGLPIAGLEAAQRVAGVTIYHAGTRPDDQGGFVTAGGRVLDIVAAGETVEEARSRAYEALWHVRFAGAAPVFRRDIGTSATRSPRLTRRDSSCWRRAGARTWPGLSRLALPAN
jgi:phosphoribosylamine--glycine ligase